MTNLLNGAHVANKLFSTIARLRLLLVMFLTLTINAATAWAETKTEGFEQATTSTNYQGTVTVNTEQSDCGIGWTIYYGCVSTSSKISGNNSAALRLYTSNNYGYLKTTTPIDGLSNVTFKAKAATSNSAKIKVNISYSKDGSTWTNIKSDETYSTTSQSKSYDIPSGGKYFQIAISSNSTKPSKSNAQLTIDDIVFTYTSSATPDPVDPTATFSNGSYTVGGSALDLSTLWTSNSDGAVTYSIVEIGTTGASINGKSFTATAAGTCTVKASQAATSAYNAIDKTATITVSAPTPANPYTVTWDVNGDKSVTTQVTEGSKPTFPDTPENCDATSNTFYGWATDPWDGKINDVSAKTIYTSANAMPEVDGNVTYYAVFAKKGTSGSGTAGWSTVTSTNDLEAGATYAISSAATKGNYLSTYTGGNNFPYSTTTICKLVLEGSEGAWTFKINDASNYNNYYLTATSTTDKNYLKAVSAVDSYCKFTISFNSGKAIITCTGKNSRNVLQYNSSNNPPIFACYSSGQSAVYLQKYSTGSTTTYSDYITTCTTQTSRYLTPKHRGDSGGT